MSAFDCQRIDKPWGHEIIWGQTDKYVGKILHVEAGESLSLQYHEIKDETIYLLSGKLKFIVGPDQDNLEEVLMEPGQSYHITTGLIHQMQAVETCDIMEVSTPELADVIRLKDIYGRV